MSTPTGLHRVKVIQNSKYVRSGIKSYVHALTKYGITPTKEGPYFRTNTLHHQGKFATGVGGKASIHHNVLMKHIGQEHKRKHGHTDPPATTTPPATTPPATTTPSSGGQTGEVTAEDIQNDSLYLVPVQIGTPAQTLNLDFDTGSADLWVWSTELPSATKTQYASSHNIFDPTKSSTFKKSSGETWTIQYGDGSTASGDVGTDTVSIGGLAIKAQAVELSKTLSASFVQGAGDGLLGLAWGNINTVKPTAVQTPVENMITQKDIPASAELFTAYLGSWRDTADADKGESFYTFGYIDQGVLKAANTTAANIHYTPVDNSQGFWQFASTSASVNGKSIALSGNTAIADTGTTLALVSDSVCQAIYNAIPGGKYDSTQQGYVFPSSVTAAQLPVVQVDVGGQLFTIQKEDLSFADAGNGMVYGGIQSRGSQDFDILGDTFLKSVYAIFDQGNTRFGCVQRTDATQNLAVPPAQS